MGGLNSSALYFQSFCHPYCSFFFSNILLHFDQLLVMLFLINLVTLKLVLTLTNTSIKERLFLSLYVNTYTFKLLSLCSHVLFFYLDYLVSRGNHIFTLTKWVSANYSDAYWSIYSCKLDQQTQPVKMKK